MNLIKTIHMKSWIDNSNLRTDDAGKKYLI